MIRLISSGFAMIGSQVGLNMKIKCVKLKRNNDCAQNGPNNRVGLKLEAPGQTTPLLISKDQIQ